MPLSNTTTCVISDFSWAQLIDFPQECGDVKDKLDELIPWLTKLLESLAKVDGNEDQQEVERRTQLARSVPDQSPSLPWTDSP